jgi:CheY-like chemotaxis protein
VDYLSHLKKNYPWIKVIVISGFDAAAEDVALETGADAFLSKPFTRAKLMDCVNTLLN